MLKIQDLERYVKNSKTTHYSPKRARRPLQPIKPLPVRTPAKPPGGGQ